jgi:hypothetical protein
MEEMPSREVTSDWNHVLYSNPPVTGGQDTHTHPRFNGAILSIAQIIKFVMASANESELAALFITAREMIPHRQTLIDMGWTQP